MRVFETKSELQSYLNKLRAENRTVGLVPTMGALHSGHLELVKRSASENDVTVVSIFVNPTQFNNQEDLEKYPKPLQQDLELLSGMEGELAIFTPEVSEIYPQGLASRTYDFEGLDRVMEGAFRPGHFDGVGTIVEQLLRTVSPDRAYFGEKDFQQLQIIRKLVEREALPVTIVGCPIVREDSGLAMSSRNGRLTESGRKEAAFIYKTLQAAREQFGTKNAQEVTEWVETQFHGHPALELEYIQISDAETLEPAKGFTEDRKYRAFIAVYADGVRLIDNIALN